MRDEPAAAHHSAEWKMSSIDQVQMPPSPVTILKEPEYTILKHPPQAEKLRKFYLRTIKINKARDLGIPITLKDTSSLWLFNKKALINCGAMDNFINQKLIKKDELEVINLATPVPVYQSDGKKTSARDVTGFIKFKMDYKGHKAII